jgi:hypothetical protein
MRSGDTKCSYLLHVCLKSIFGFDLDFIGGLFSEVKVFGASKIDLFSQFFWQQNRQI